ARTGLLPPSRTRRSSDLALASPERVRTLTIGCSYCGGEGSQLMDPADFQGLVEAMASGNQDNVFQAMYELNLSPGFRAEESHYEDRKTTRLNSSHCPISS